VAAQATEAIGGPWGRYAVTGRALFWTPLRVCLLFTTVVLALAWLKQAPCAAGNWTGHLQYTHFCYSDTVPLFGLHHLDTGAVPYLESPVEYPVLTGAFMAAAAAVARVYDHAAATLGFLPDVPPVESYYVVTCLLLSFCALLVTRAVLGMAGRRPWDAAMVALSPLLFVHAFTNWDLFAVALATLGMWAWARQRPLLAGVLLGLGVAAKLYPLVLLAALFLLCLRAGRLRVWLRTAVAAAVAWVVVDAPVAVLAPENWSRFFRLNSSRPADPDTIWNIALTMTHHRLFDGPLAVGQTPSVLNVVVAGGLLALVAAAAWLTLAAPVRPRVAQLAFLLTAGFLLLNKVWSPQYSLWLLPLAVLARPRWRSLLLWQATEALLWVPRLLWYLGTDNRGVGVEWFLLGVALRDVAVLVLMGLVVRDILRPDGDVVRAGWPGVDDPAGGVLDGAPDMVTLRATPRPGAVPESRRAVESRLRGTLRANDTVTLRATPRPGAVPESRRAVESRLRGTLRAPLSTTGLRPYDRALRRTAISSAWAWASPGVSRTTGQSAVRATSTRSSVGISPSVRGACRSRLEPAGSRLLLRCTRSIRPVTARMSSTTVVRSQPAAQAWQVSSTNPAPNSPTASQRRPIASMSRAMAFPPPAVFSMSRGRPKPPSSAWRAKVLRQLSTPTAGSSLARTWPPCTTIARAPIATAAFACAPRSLRLGIRMRLFVVATLST
jgi:uncharacterized membrane protein